jgi:uncharacterized membrane protein
MLGYAARLRRDLARWRERGWISAEQEERMAGDAAANGGFSAGAVLAILGAVLLCLAILTFVAANWEALPRLVRLGVLFGALWLSYAIAYGLFRTGRDHFGHAMLLIGGAVFGASIMLIAQTYHISGNPTDAVLLWGAGVLLAAVLMQSTASLVFAILLLAVWLVIGETEGLSISMWQFAIAWGVCAAAVWRQNSQLALNALLLVLLIAIFREFMRETLPPGAACQFGFAVYVLAGGRRAAIRDERAEHLFPTLAAYGALIALGDLMLLQVGEPFVALPAASIAGLAWSGLAAALVAVGGALFIRSFPPVATAGLGLYAVLLRLALPPLIAPLIDKTTFDVYAGTLILAGSLWLIADGGRRGLRSIATTGYAFFLAELLYIYFKTFGGLLETALFYLLAGLLLITMSVIFVIAERRKAQRSPA